MRQRISLSQHVRVIRELINLPAFKEMSRKGKRYFTRNRKMGFVQLIYFMLNLVKSSTFSALEKFFDDFADGEIEMSQQAFSEARQKLKPVAFEELYRTTVRTTYSGDFETWRGYRVFAIDGTKIALPNFPYLAEEFGELKGSPTAIASALYDVFNHVIADVRIDKLSVDERTLAEQHIEFMNTSLFGANELVIHDRGYASFELAKQYVDSDIFFLMRVRKKFNVEIDNIKEADSTMYLSDGDDCINIRVIKFVLDSGEEEVLITTLFDPDITVDDFKWLYYKRWPIETKYDIVKNKLQVENFSGRTPDAIKQDFYISMMMSNLVDVAVLESQPIIDNERNGGTNKHAYKANINETIGTFKRRFVKALLESDEKKCEKMITRIIRKIANAVIPIRLERKVPRKANTRNSKFHHNRKSNL